MTDELVDRGVAPDVLARLDETPLRIEEPRSVQAAGLLEDVLGTAQRVR